MRHVACEIIGIPQSTWLATIFISDWPCKSRFGSISTEPGLPTMSDLPSVATKWRTSSNGSFVPKPEVYLT